jgi:hypothetical protein
MTRTAGVRLSINGIDQQRPVVGCKSKNLAKRHAYRWTAPFR